MSPNQSDDLSERYAWAIKLAQELHASGTPPSAIIDELGRRGASGTIVLMVIAMEAWGLTIREMKLAPGVDSDGVTDRAAFDAYISHAIDVAMRG